MNSKNLWPSIDLFDNLSKKAPEKILKEQAEFLTQMAPKSIDAKIIQAVNRGISLRITSDDPAQMYASLGYTSQRNELNIDFRIYFRFVVFAKNVNYDFELLRISYMNGKYYPLELTDCINDTEEEINSEGCFIEALQKMFNTEKVTNTIKNTIKYSGGTEL